MTMEETTAYNRSDIENVEYYLKMALRMTENVLWMRHISFLKADRICF